MTDRSEVNNTTNSSTVRTLNRGQIEQALKAALTAGPESLPQQLRYILALCQLGNAPTSVTPHERSPMTISEARLEALVALAGSLGNVERRALSREVKRLPEDDVRLRLMLKLIPYLTPDISNNTLQELFRQAAALPSPVDRSEIMIGLARLLPKISLDQHHIASTLADAIAVAQNISNTEARVRGLVALAPFLPKALSLSLFNNVLDEIDTLTSDTQRTNTLNAMADHLMAEAQERVIASAAAIEDPQERARAYTALSRNATPEALSIIREKALETIAAIRSEDERGEALVAYAPHLESASLEDGFPKLLEIALGIAISLSRRAVRARALVALAPHLTRDLQGEALAAVNNLSSESERAALLAQLAPTLPPNMVVASLAVAHTMREQDARVHALTMLAHHAPEQARNQTLLDALAAASNLPRRYERAKALIDLMDTLPPNLFDQAVANALETVRLIENENARSRALGLLAQHLPPKLQARALEIANDIHDQQQQLNALINLVPHIEDDQKNTALRKMLENTRLMPFEYKKARALISVAPHLSGEHVDEALRIAERLEDPFDRASATIALAHRLDKDRQAVVIDLAWGLIDEIDDGYDRSSVLAAIAALLPESRNKALAEQARSVIHDIPDEYDQASAITILAPLLIHGDLVNTAPSLDEYSVLKQGISEALQVPQQMPRAELLALAVEPWRRLSEEPRYTLWKEVVPQIIRLPLADALLALGRLMPLLADFHPESGLRDIAQVLGLR